MHIQADRLKENKTKPAANAVTQSKGKQGIALIDNRPEAIAQRKLKEITNNHVIQRVISIGGNQYNSLQTLMKSPTDSKSYFDSKDKEGFIKKLSEPDVYIINDEGVFEKTEESPKKFEDTTSKPLEKVSIKGLAKTPDIIAKEKDTEQMTTI